MRRVIVLALVLVAACAAVTPGPTGPGTDWPCGYHGISCGNHMCCDDNEICGTENQGVNGEPFSGCAPGYCCYSGNDAYVVSVSRPKKQYREQRP